MLDWFAALHPVSQAVLAALFTWGVTALGAATAVFARSVLPYALAFAAGAMIFVVLEDAIPEAERSGNTDLAATAAMLGFVVMMVLDVAFG